MHGINDSGDYKCNLNKYFTTIKKSNFIAFAPFAGFYNKNNNKKLSIDAAQNIVDAIKKSGYNVAQIGGTTEPKLNGAMFVDFTYFKSLQFILGCKCLISTDTGMRWAASAYDFPTIGLDSNEFYGNRISAIQPINKNAIYLDELHVDKISLDKILDSVKLI
ncbi:MAG: hypothetical protein EKK57_10840 [Proteobacteria bacterium]|nr:MAG: hypothetical protein EKK57_10840 [Pseudomonadota bacterium]